MSRRLTPLARLPFRHVRQTTTQARALESAVRRLALTDYPLALERPTDRRVSAKAQRDVLLGRTRRTDGAGRCFLTVETIKRDSGWRRRTVFRSLAALDALGHLERHRHVRAPERYPATLPRQARVGQGPTIYRIGAAIRAAAGLLEFDWTPECSEPRSSAEASGVALPGQRLPDPFNHALPRGVAPPGGNDPRGTPSPDPVAQPSVHGNFASESPSRGTPRTKNGKQAGKGRGSSAQASSDSSHTSRAPTATAS